MSVSVIIPARNEIYLQKTIESVCKSAREEYEVLVVLDGYLPDPPIDTGNPRVKFIHNPTAVGQRPAINQAARLATGKYIFKLDAHCMVDEGFDLKLAADCEPDWTVIPRMYVLHAENWEPKLRKCTDFMYFNSPVAREHPFCIQYYDAETARNFKTQYRAFKNAAWTKGDICDTMASLGAGFFMHTARFRELGGLDEGHAHWGQMGVEIACKSWLSGGRQVVNKKTWFAHQWRAHAPWKLLQRDVDFSRDYSISLWTKNQWPGQKRPLSWLVEKFAPVPTWETPIVDTTEQIEQFAKIQYDYFRGIPTPKNNAPHRWPSWKGIPVIKYPADMINYAQIIEQNKPDYLIECGTQNGGSAHWFADTMESVGKGMVITIDKMPCNIPPHNRIISICGRTTACDTLEKIRALNLRGKNVMVSLDSSHDRAHVKRELYYYGPMVTPGQYLIIEDCYPKSLGANEAVDWYLQSHGKEYTEVLTGFLLSLNRWLKRQ